MDQRPKVRPKTLISTSKDTIKKVKRQSLEWENIFAEYISAKELASKIHKELLQQKRQIPLFKNRQSI